MTIITYCPACGCDHTEGETCPAAREDAERDLTEPSTGLPWPAWDTLEALGVSALPEVMR